MVVTPALVSIGELVDKENVRHTHSERCHSGLRKRKAIGENVS